ncbi:MAG: single-stranded DNA-binding protein [Anaerolineales bacterium]|nr:single-stranded DNA-binding protein [Anaerolineales bacterium]MCS7246644.1 single-stranded DNA-binding protein [Anaerolineales bacterium]MDW8160454.1 single-stranded DNA-binding protein [Anaerolineales bacterium]MDW8446068.1 single-stranded DNA-binding protein [Anaerolineales bacterium]
MYHTIILAGNLGRDPEMRYTPTGQAVTTFSVAVDDSYTSSTGERISRTIWFRVSVWGKQAEVANQYLKKGAKVLVEGRLVVDASTGGPRTWNRQDGTVAASFEVSARTFRFLSPRAETEATEPLTELSELESGGEEDIPF